jgi:hypothetical protein
MLKPLSKGVPFSIGDEENSEPVCHPDLRGRSSPFRRQTRSAALHSRSMDRMPQAPTSTHEQAMLNRQGAASGYAERENIDLRHKLSTLERKVAVDGTGPAKGRKRRLADQAKGK